MNKLMLSKHVNSLLTLPKCLFASIMPQLPLSTITSSFSTLTNKASLPLLVPQNVRIIPTCGLKVRGKLDLRCKDCYLVRREGRLYVMCHSFPRHKQVKIAKREKYTWIMSHACMSKLRPY